MSVVPEQVATALGDALNVKAVVSLQHIDDVPFAVVEGPSGVETWIDLRTSIAGGAGRDATHIAAMIMAFEGWDAPDLDRLLGEICTKLGICDPLYEREKIRSGGPYDVDAFTDAVLKTEGLDPMTTAHRRQVQDIVKSHFGAGPD